MARKATKKDKPNKTGPKPEYDWDKWLKVGNHIVLTRHKDFKAERKSMAIMLRRKARYRQLSVSIAMHEDNKSLIVKVSKPSKKKTK